MKEINFKKRYTEFITGKISQMTIVYCTTAEQYFCLFSYYLNLKQ